MHYILYSKYREKGITLTLRVTLTVFRSTLKERQNMVLTYAERTRMTLSAGKGVQEVDCDMIV